MPYIPTRSGQSVFIKDPQEAQQRYQQEWGQASPAPVKAQPAPAAAPADKPKPKRGFDLKEFLKSSPAGLYYEGMKRLGETIGKIPVPFGGGQTIGQEAPRVVADIPRQVVNAPIAAAEQLGAVTQGAAPAGLLGGPMTTGSLEADKQREVQKAKNAEAAIDALQKTGRDVQGFSYGIKPQTPIVGSLFSEDSEFVKKNIKPKTAIGQLASSVGAAIAFDAGVNKLTKATALAGKTVQTADKLVDIWKNKDLAAGARVMATYLIKDVLPESVQDAMFFMPQPPAALAKDLDEIQKLQTPEERIRAAEVLRATTPEEFNYAFEQFKNVSQGVAFTTGLRGTFMLANKFLSKATSNVPAAQALEEATQETLPVLRQEVEADGLVKANEIIQDKLGAVTSELYKKIDENVGKVAFGARAGAETYLQKQQDLVPDLQRLQDELKAVPDVGQDRIATQAEIDSLQSVLGVKTPEQLATKQKMLEDRLVAYETAAAADPDWINKSTGAGRKRTKNSTKVRMAAQTAERLQQLQLLQTKLQQLDNVELDRAAKLSALEAKVAESKTAFTGFSTALNDARILVDKLDELNAERIGYLQNYNNILFKENRINEINTDYSLNDAFGLAYGELKDILNAAEAAVASDNINPDFARMFVQRVDEIHNKVIDNGGLAPVVPRVPEGVEVPPQAVEEVTQVAPKAPAPVANEVPVTKTDAGEIVVDTDTLGAERVMNESRAGSSAVRSGEEVIEETRRDLGIYQDPTDTIEQLEWFTRAKDNVAKEWDRVFKKTGSEEAANKAATALRNTNAVKYTSKFENAAALKAVFNTADRSSILPQQYAKSMRTLASFLGGNSQLRQISFFLEAAEFGKDVQNNLNKIQVPVAALDENAAAVLASSRDLRKILRNEEVPGIDRITALDNFRLNFETFVANAKALNELMYGVGNALRQFSKGARLDFSRKDPKVLFNRLNQELASFGSNDDFASLLADKSKAAKADLEEKYGELFNKLRKGEDLTEEELQGLDNFVEKVYEAQGDFEKLDALEVTADAVLARLQVGSPLSNPATVFSIPIQGIPETALELTGQAIGGTITGRMAKWLGQTEFAKETLEEASLAADTLLQTRHVIGEALDATYNRFVYGKAITDPAQVADAAYELRRAGGLRREEAISQDLAQTRINLPFFNYVMERAEGDDKIFDTLNKARVFTKVFHDYFMPGEAWDKRSFFGKYIMGATTTGLRGLGVGKQSYYPGGENVNLTLFNQLSAAADEMSTSFFANAHVRALVIKDVDNKIAEGLIERADRASAISEGLNKEMSNMYQPVRAGFDQNVIGYSINEERILNLTRAVNLTEELSGPLANVADSVNALRNSKHPALAAFGRDVFPFLTSPLNGIKRAAMISYGGEMVQASVDAVRLGAKNLPDEITKFLPPKVRQDIVDFESKYLSSDPKVRIRAQGALALSVGINALAWFLVRDGNQDITAGLENTYRETEGTRDPYTWKIGAMMLPYRYLPVIGNTIAFQSNIRDLQEFAPGRDTSGAFALTVAALANTILETPAIAGFDRIVKALTSASTGDVSRMQKVIADSVAKIGDPYLNLRKVAAQGIDPRKPASPITRFARKGFYERGKLGEKGINMADIGNTIVDSAFGSFGIAAEYSPVGFIADAVASAINQDPEFRIDSRKALWYGKPGATVNANHAGKWYPIQAALGRYWLFPDKLEDNPVAKEMNYNLIPPPRTTLFNSDGVGINASTLNQFNHFLNSEVEFYDPTFNKTYKGVYGYLKDLVTSKSYTQYPSVDSPFRMGGSLPPAYGLVQNPNWDREQNMRRVILKGEVDRLISIAKEQFLMGDLPGQRYKAPEEMKQRVIQNRLAGGTR
jgi:hypothetical protein